MPARIATVVTGTSDVSSQSEPGLNSYVSEPGDTTARAFQRKRKSNSHTSQQADPVDNGAVTRASKRCVLILRMLVVWDIFVSVACPRSRNFVRRTVVAESESENEF